MKRYAPASLLIAASLVLISSASALDLRLQGKTALVTGSTSNIGYAIAQGLLREGARVIVNARSAEAVRRAVESLEASTGHEALTFVGDMSKPEDIARLTRTYPSVDILVNNVSEFDAKPFEQSTDRDWLDTFNLNVMSGVRLSRAYLPGMRQRNWGRIIFISSESALQIPVESIHYGMTKAAEIAVARGLAESLAGTGVTVNSVLPGPTRDPADPRFAQMAKSLGKSPEALEQEFIRSRRPTSLIKRFERPEEVAAMVVFVASPLSSGTTGAALRVDGGVVKSAF
jgi:NAD(P)-dependent dehydrogenase (short-subunit alcohol dehydrogenase family)